MAKIQFRAREYPRAIFTCNDDPDFEPGQTLSIPLQQLRPDWEFWLPDRVQELVKKHIKGDPDHPDPALRQPWPILLEDGSMLKVSEPLLWNVVTLEAMQTAREAEERYSWLEFCEMAVCNPDAFRRLVLFANTLNNTQKKGPEGLKDPAAGSPQSVSSAALSTSTPMCSNGSPTVSLTSESNSAEGETGEELLYAASRR